MKLEQQLLINREHEVRTTTIDQQGMKNQKGMNRSIGVRTTTIDQQGMKIAATADQQGMNNNTY